MRNIKMIMVILTVGLLILGCGESDPNNPGNHLPTVNGGLDKTAKVSDTINLTAIGLDVDGDTLTYTWSFKSKPTGSTATLTTNNNKVSFVADKEGAYLLNVVANDGLADSSVDTVKVTVTATGMVVNPVDISTCTEVAYSITTDTLWDATCYKVVSNIDVSNSALLTIKEGTQVIFDKDKLLTVSDGALKAVGTATKPILFTGVQKTAGYWYGLNIRGDDIRNKIDYAVIEYAGGGYSSGALRADGRIKISNSTIQYSGSDGFNFDASTIIDTFTNVTSTQNRLTAGIIHANILDKFDNSSDFTGNIGHDYLTVNGISGDITTGKTWKPLSVPAFLTGNFSVKDKALLTIEAGATFICDKDFRLSIDDAGLKAVGTDTKPITFTGGQETAGYWYGITFHDANDARTELAHMVVEYAGGGYYPGSILTSGSSRIKIKDSLLQHSGTDGFNFGSDTIIDEFKNVTSTKNTLTAGLVHTNLLDAFDNSSDFTGNLGHDYLTASSVSGEIVTDTVWKPLTVPVFLTGTLAIKDNALLTIEAGASFLGDSGVVISASSGALKAIGTPTNPITFSGLQKTAGYWGGLSFSTADTRNELGNVIVEYGGGAYYGANIYAHGKSMVNVHDSNITNSSSYGIYIGSDAVVTNTNNTFTNNANGSVGTN